MISSKLGTSIVYGIFLFLYRQANWFIDQDEKWLAVQWKDKVSTEPVSLVTTKGEAVEVNYLIALNEHLVYCPRSSVKLTPFFMH